MDTPPPARTPDPAELRELAGRTEQLAADIHGVLARLDTAADDPTRRVGYRLDEATARSAARALRDTAEDLARIRGRGDPARGGCAADWGVCPVHGNTLRSSGGQSWCTSTGCGRTWSYDCGGLPCTEPAASRVTDAEGGTTLLCAGHTVDARARLIGATVEALPAPGQP